ncbi:hypothetical protein MRX96_019442 [Rhipicephalus microplus]
MVSTTRYSHLSLFSSGGGKPEGDLDETVPDDVIGGSSPLLEERSTWLPAHKSPGECGMLPFFSLASLVVNPFPSSDFTSGTAPSSDRSWWAIMSPPGGRLPARRVRRVYDWRWLLRLPHTWTGVSCNMCAPTDAGSRALSSRGAAVSRPKQRRHRRRLVVSPPHACYPSPPPAAQGAFAIPLLRPSWR